MRDLVTRVCALAAAIAAGSAGCSVDGKTFTPSVGEVSFATETSITDETIGAAAVAVVLLAPRRERVTVEVVAAGGSATASTDYALASTTATFEPGETRVEVPVAIIDDQLAEPEEDVRFELRAPVAAELGEHTTHLLRISANALPRLRFTAMESSAAETAGEQSIELELDTASSTPVVVAYTWSGSVEPADHDIPATGGQLTIPAGARTATLAFGIHDDPTDEDDEDLELTLTAMTGAVVDPDLDTHRHTIQDDDAPPTISITGGATVAEAGGMQSLTVSLSAISERSISIAYAVTGSAEDTDFALTAAAHVFAPGTQTHALGVSANDDAVDEDDESIEITLVNAVNATIASAGATDTVLIADNDLPPTVSLLSGAPAVPEGGEHAFTISLSAASERTVGVTYATVSGGTATPGADYVAISKSITIAPGDTTWQFALPATQDALDEDNETVVVTLDAVTNATVASGAQSLVIVDDDPLPTLSFTSATSALSEGQASVIVASLSAPSGRAVSFSLQLSGTASTLDVELPGVVTIPPGDTSRSFAFNAVQDGISETNELATLSFAAVSNAAVGGQSTHTVNIQNVDITTLAVHFTVPPALVPRPELDQGAFQELTYDVALTAPATFPIAVSVRLLGTATLNDDYNSSPTLLVFQPGETVRNFHLVITGDNVPEEDEVITMVLEPELDSIAVQGGPRRVVIVNDDGGVIPI